MYKGNIHKSSLIFLKYILSCARKAGGHGVCECVCADCGWGNGTEGLFTTVLLH